VQVIENDLEGEGLSMEEFEFTEFNYSAIPQGSDNEVSSDEETFNYNQVPVQYDPIASDDESTETPQAMPIDTTQDKLELSPEAIRKNRESMETFDKKYQQEAIKIHAEAAKKEFEMTSIQVEEIKEAMKTIQLKNVPRWAQIAPQEKKKEES